jgi:hypothetical protein
MDVMVEADEDFDEVALNVLLAEGLDIPTAWEASRRDRGSESRALNCTGAMILLVFSVLALLASVFLLR